MAERIKDEWRTFADFLRVETGDEISVRDLKGIISRAVQDRTTKKTIANGGNPLFESIFAEDDIGVDGEQSGIPGDTVSE